MDVNLPIAIISRPEALRLGLLRYNTGEPCVNGHVSERKVKGRRCLACQKDKIRNWWANPEMRAKRKLKIKEWREANPAKIKAIRDKFDLRHRDKLRADNREFYKNNPDYNRAKLSRRRGLNTGAIGKFSCSDVTELLRKQDNLCANPFCATNITDSYTIDHKTPLSRGGSNWPRNLQLLCSPCNSSKCTKTRSEWLRSLRQIQENKMAKKPENASIAADYNYKTTKIRGKDGKVRTSRGNGDAVANAMLVFTAGGGDVQTVISANKLTDKMAAHLKKKGPKAAGIIRMCLGVMLRALVRNGTPVKIGKTTVSDLKQKVEVPKVVKAEKKAA